MGFKELMWFKAVKDHLFRRLQSCTPPTFNSSRRCYSCGPSHIVESPCVAGWQVYLSFSLRVEHETPILWPPDVKSWLIWKDPDAGKDWGQEEKGMAEDEMVGWHHRLNGHGFGWTPGVGDVQGGLVAAVHGVSKNQAWLNDWTELNMQGLWEQKPYTRKHWQWIASSVYLNMPLNYFLHCKLGGEKKLGALPKEFILYSPLFFEKSNWHSEKFKGFPKSYSSLDK